MSVGTLKQTHIPALWYAESTVHCGVAAAGEMRIDCSLSTEPTEEEVSKHLRVSIPGESEFLRPLAVDRNGDRMVVGMFSSDVANSGRVPSSMKVYWIDRICAHELGEATVRSASEAASDTEAADTAVPGSTPTSGYPRTVAALPIVLLIGAVVAFAAWLLMH